MLSQCNNCAFRDINSVCQIFKTRVEPTRAACPGHKSTLYNCNNCGRPIINALTWTQKSEESWTPYCEECSLQIGNCPTCARSTTCVFETDPSPLPKVVVKTIRQGNTQMQIQIRNPERIDVTCREKCKCFDPENGCLRQMNMCMGWVMR